MFWPLGVGQQQKAEPPFRSRMSSPPERSIVFLGAGASAGAGCPIMRGFIDLATDFLAAGKFTDSEADDVKVTLNLYNAIRRSFAITEEDVENVETILSLADLEAIVGKGPIPELSTPGISNSVRSFIERVITKAGRAASPNSPRWLGSRLDGPMVYYKLVHALAYQKEKVTVITLNYDCLLEYTCYCLGVPFTYNRHLGDGIEILKLHGSVNWLRCVNEHCQENSTVHISPLEFVASNSDIDEGYIDRKNKVCDSCGKKLIPVIIPPTWAKHLDEIVIQPFWARSLKLLQQCESFVTAGFSLPVSDSHVRHLLHLGFSSSKLRQALAIVGSDVESAERWSKFFRESWRSSRFEIRNKTFSASIESDIFPALVINFNEFDRPNSSFSFPPILYPDNSGTHKREAIKTVIGRDGKQPEQVEKELQVDWRHVCIQMLENAPVQHESTKKYRKIVEEAGLLWKPAGEILPSHGNKLVSDK